MGTPSIEALVKSLTVEEKAQLCGGKDFWSLHAVERLGLPSIMVTDGPHGLRKQSADGDHVGLNAAVPATCFPTASATAATWNPSLIEKMGKALGAECRAEDVSVLLGPGINLKRHPLGGRNFEYFSEDPRLAGDLATAWIKGVQQQGVGTSLKHYSVNNHEFGRMTVDAIIDQRTLRELYLSAFEKAVKDSQPWTVMCSYNKINGVYAAEHKQLLNDILVEEWGFEGIVVTDWGANNNRVAGLKAGQTLEMPSSGDMNTKKIIAALEDGCLTELELDYAVTRLLELIVKAKDNLTLPRVQADLHAHHDLAREVAHESVVLLKNDNGILPVEAKQQKVAVIGALAAHARYQGSGSSKINPFKLEQPLDELKKAYGAENVSFAQGYHLDNTSDLEAISEAQLLAKESDVVFVFAGLTPKYESECFDRSHLDLPQNQLELIAALAAYKSKVVVILQNGAPVTMPFIDDVSGVIEAYLGGQAGASAVADIITGKVNPSGKLAETFPLHLDDVPSTPYFPGNGRQVQYREGIWVGYRYFDTANQAVLFPFGHGLSYSSYDYSNLTVEAPQALAADANSVVTVSLDVTNTSERDGAEIVQLYMGQANPSVPRPLKELAAYQKVFIKAGETKTLTFKLDYRTFAFWDVLKQRWTAETDNYSIFAAASIADVRLEQSFTLNSDTAKSEPQASLANYFTPAKRDFSEPAFAALLGYEIPAEDPVVPYGMNSRLGDIKDSEVGSKVYQGLLEAFGIMLGGDENASAAEADRLMAEAMVADMPLRNLAVFARDRYSEKDVLALIEQLNQ